MVGGLCLHGCLGIFFSVRQNKIDGRAPKELGRVRASLPDLWPGGSRPTARPEIGACACCCCCEATPLVPVGYVVNGAEKAERLVKPTPHRSVCGVVESLYPVAYSQCAVVTAPVAIEAARASK
jgi:hypothetical protein